MSAAPPYHLRPNKAVERLLFVELLKRVDRLRTTKIADYSYVGLGGPYLEDFNLIHTVFGNRDMISLEAKKDVLTRQHINQPHSSMKLMEMSTDQFVEEYVQGKKPLLVWFDYSTTDWKSQIKECCDLLGKLPEMSIFKVTLCAKPGKLGSTVDQRLEKLNRTFADFKPFVKNDVYEDNFQKTLYRIFRSAVAEAMPDTPELCVRSLASYRYNDGTPILTITTILGPIERIEKIIREGELDNWPFADINWGGPVEIVVPHLSLRERLALDQLLPDADAQKLMQKLNLWLADDEASSLKAIATYIQFYRHVPQFLRVSL
jgi:hypothetical protein